MSYYRSFYRTQVRIAQENSDAVCLQVSSVAATRSAAAIPLYYPNSPRKKGTFATSGVKITSSANRLAHKRAACLKLQLAAKSISLGLPNKVPIGGQVDYACR